ncbi:unnamed protein product [Rotaria magnacalcarata]|uniref:protein-serine/threonine phosphatase n=1 Tax=Rotaria magnacalcarata TaxID=392030 RepID=A0A8S2JUX7_9BILA|nr:unnamed protein product [Rotaria magnacalcarata]
MHRSKRRYNIKLWKSFNACFNCLPVAAIVAGKIFCCQGGLSPDLHSLEQIQQIQRPIDVPDAGLLFDLLWSDPDNDLKRWSENDAGISFRFGVDIVNEFLNRHKMDLICRAHQVIKDGYEFFADRRLVTIFSAPDYLGSFENAGALMSVDENLMCSFMILHSSSEQANEQDNKNLKADCQAQSVSDSVINPPVTKVGGCQKCVSCADMNDSASPQ